MATDDTQLVLPTPHHRICSKFELSEAKKLEYKRKAIRILATDSAIIVLFVLFWVACLSLPTIYEDKTRISSVKVPMAGFGVTSVLQLIPILTYWDVLSFIKKGNYEAIDAARILLPSSACSAFNPILNAYILFGGEDEYHKKRGPFNTEYIVLSVVFLVMQVAISISGCKAAYDLDNEFEHVLNGTEFDIDEDYEHRKKIIDTDNSDSQQLLAENYRDA